MNRLPRMINSFPEQEQFIIFWVFGQMPGAIFILNFHKIYKGDDNYARRCTIYQSING